MVKYAIRWGTEESMRKLHILGKGFKSNLKDYIFFEGHHENACQKEDGTYLSYHIEEHINNGYTIIDAEDYIKLKSNIFKQLLIW
jgi:hypothetical protein